MLFGYDQGVMSGLFSAGQFAADFPKLAEVPPYAPADPHSSPSNPEFNSSVQGAVTAVSNPVLSHLPWTMLEYKTETIGILSHLFADLRNRCSVWFFDRPLEG